MESANSREWAKPTAQLIVQARKVEIVQLCDAIGVDADVIVVGVTGSGRQHLVEFAIRRAGAKLIEVDCIQATSRRRLVELFWKGLRRAFSDEETIQEILTSSTNPLFHGGKVPFAHLTLEKLGLDGDVTSNERIFEFAKALLDAVEELASGCDVRVVVMLKNVVHIQSWDRDDSWYKEFGKRITDHEYVSYVRIATFGELQSVDSKHAGNEEAFPGDREPERIVLAKLDNASLQSWALLELRDRGLIFDPLRDGLEKFLDIVQGHFGDTLTLIRRLALMFSPPDVSDESPMEIDEQHVKDALDSVLEDFHFAFETLLMLLPDTQKRLLECLVLDPTKKPHSATYANKYDLPRGGTIQGALKGLEKKGLLYDADHDYAIAMPLLAQWIKKQRDCSS